MPLNADVNASLVGSRILADAFGSQIIASKLGGSSVRASLAGGDSKSQLVASATGGEEASSRHTDFVFGQKELIGLCAVYAAIGTVNGFFASYIQIPVCQYVFGFPSTQLCNAAPSVFQLSWSFKLFVGFIIDNFSFFGSRRKGWILFGWTLGLGMLAVNAIMVERFIEEQNFEAYLLLMSAMCWCYIFSDVGVDGLAVELTKFESEENRGKTLIIANTTRFVFIMLGSVIGLLFMSGKDYQPKNLDPTAIIFPFEISYQGIHWLILCMALPSYVLMWVCLKDPPPLENHPRGFKGMVDSCKRMWQAFQSFAFFMMVIQIFGIYAISGMGNPALSLVSMIAAPPNFVNSIGVVGGNMFLVVGIWMFKRYLMAYNWRFTLLWTHTLVALCALLNIMIIWNTLGAQDPWFYTVQNSVPSVLQGMYFLLTQLATAEISPPGLEATFYELMLSSASGAMSMGVALQNLFVPRFDLEGITPELWTDNHCAAKNGTWSEDPSPVCHTYQEKMALATWVTLGINVFGAVAFMWFLPKNAQQCRDWQAKESWHNTRVGVLNFVIYFVPWLYATILLLQQTF